MPKTFAQYCKLRSKGVLRDEIYYDGEKALSSDNFNYLFDMNQRKQDSFRVVTASRDLSLRVLTWRNDKQHGLTLESQYHLLGGSHTRSRGFTNVVCDYSSIVASVDSVDGNDVLKAYTFDF